MPGRGVASRWWSQGAGYRQASPAPLEEEEEGGKRGAVLGVSVSGCDIKHGGGGREKKGGLSLGFQIGLPKHKHFQCCTGAQSGKTGLWWLGESWRVLELKLGGGREAENDREYLAWSLFHSRERPLTLCNPQSGISGRAFVLHSVNLCLITDIP